MLSYGLAPARKLTLDQRIGSGLGLVDASEEVAKLERSRARVNIIHVGARFLKPSRLCGRLNGA
jgi:hypothetical protein